MQMNKIRSSNIHAIGYEPAESRLRVQFLRKGEDDDGKPAMVPGDIYDYDGVPADIYDGLIAAEHPGAEFALKVRKGGFKFRKLEPDVPVSQESQALADHERALRFGRDG
jgi:KTSC domain